MHYLALLNARHLISSQADDYIFLGRPKDVARSYKFIFLQHGVLLHDLSKWLGNMRIDCLLTTNAAERQYLLERSAYKLKPEQVVLTGLPRHDALLRRPPSRRNLIAIMPTWRRSLVGRSDSMTSVRKFSDDLIGSSYFRKWKALLHSVQLLELTRLHGYQVTFVPHANLLPYVGWFSLPPNVATGWHARQMSIQDIFVTPRF
jgi:hypothetical protein